MNRRCLGCMKEYSDQFDVCPHCGYIVGTPAQEVYHMQPGTVLEKKYLIGRVLGFGGFGVTYLGYDMMLERRVAIKEYLPGEFSTRMPQQLDVTVYSGDRAEQFNAGKEKMLEEARRLKALENIANVLRVYDFFEANNTAYMVMEYVDGETVKDLLAREGKLPVERALPIIRSVITDLKEVHKTELLHRDIAPDNIKIQEDGTVKLLDFGASRFATTSHSRSLSVIIKPGYAPEEQYRSRGDQGPWTDVYALAATFYKMITGFTPPDAMERAAQDLLKPPSKLGVNISKDMENALLNALVVPCEYRTQSMEEFEKELDAAERGEKVPLKTGKRAGIDIGRMPASVKIGAAIGAVCVAALFAAAMLVRVAMVDKEWQIPEGSTQVPNFVNLALADAGNAAEENSLNVSVQNFEYSSLMDPDVVVRQDTEAAKIVEKNSTVGLSVSRGREKVQVPAVEGILWEEAEKLLSDETLELKIDKKEISDRSMPAGMVLKQSPEGNTAAFKGSTVTVSVVKDEGQTVTPDDLVPVEVPDVVGKDWKEAQTILMEAGLNARMTREYGTREDKDKVLRQSIAAGEETRKGTEIEIVYSLGPEMVQMPEVRAKTEAEAVAELEGLGFRVKQRQEYSDTYDAGKISAQSVESGEMAEKGSEITITVSLGKKPRETEARQTRPALTAPAVTAPPVMTQPAQPETPIPTNPPVQETSPPPPVQETPAPVSPASPGGGGGIDWDALDGHIVR